MFIFGHVIFTSLVNHFIIIISPYWFQPPSNFLSYILLPQPTLVHGFFIYLGGKKTNLINLSFLYLDHRFTLEKYDTLYSGFNVHQGDSALWQYRVIENSSMVEDNVVEWGLAWNSSSNTYQCHFTIYPVEIFKRKNHLSFSLYSLIH